MYLSLLYDSIDLKKKMYIFIFKLYQLSQSKLNVGEILHCVHNVIKFVKRLDKILKIKQTRVYVFKKILKYYWIKQSHIQNCF